MPSDEQIALVQQVSMAFRSTDTNIKREALDMLLYNFHSPDPNIRQECVKQLHRLFPQFPDSKENCINSVYDACEDTNPDVRKEGYRAISRFSELDHSLVRRNADVLVQLLQSDDPGELEIIKANLASHFKTDALATIQVLCDSCLPAPDATDREQLRGLVLEFLTNPSSSGRRDLRTLNEESERLMFTELCKAIPYCTPHQTQLVVQFIATTRTIATSSELSNMLIGSLSDRIDRELDSDKTKQIDMPSFMPLVIAAGMAAQKFRECDSLPIFQRLCNGPLRRISSATPPNLHSQTFVRNLVSIASLYTKPEQSREDAIPTLDLLVDTIPQLLPIVLLVPIMWQEISVLLQAILDRSKRSGWRLTRAHIDALQTIQAQVGLGPAPLAQPICADLLQRILPPSKPRSPKANEKGDRISFVNAAQRSESLTRRLNLPKRKLEEEQHSQIPPTRPASAPSLASRLGLQHPTQPAAMRSNRISTDQQPPTKRMKENGTPFDSPNSSLLARIQDGAKQRGQDIQPGNAPSGGFRIKGAGTTQRLEDRMAHH